MKVVLNTWSTSEDYNADCDYALVDLTSNLAARILTRMNLIDRLRKDDMALHEVSFWDATAEFFATPDEESLAEYLPEDGDSFTVLPEGIEIPVDSFQRTDCDRLNIDVCGSDLEVSWRSYPRHVTLQITTTSVPRSFLEKVAGRMPSAAPPMALPDAHPPARGREYLLDIDGPLFRQQRAFLLAFSGRLRRNKRVRTNDIDVTLLEGLIERTDAIADQAHDRHGIDCLLDQRG
jgi:hypothetical protein